MKKTKKLTTILIILTFAVLMTACGTSSSEKDLRSGFDKWSNGDYNSMTNSEKRLVNDFLEWSND